MENWKSRLESLVNMPVDNNLESFYSGKKVLITGHTGFKGGWLSLWLLKLGANVIGYALSPATNPSFFDVVKLTNKISSKISDIRNKVELEFLLNQFKPEIVIHMAAQALVRTSYDDPVATYESNIMGTVNILDACRKSTSVKSIVIITSDKCYENHGENKPFEENNPMGGHDPYSSSKGCAELVTAAYQKSFFSMDEYKINHTIALASARAGNVIGGGDWNKDRLIPDCIKSIIADEEILIRYPHAIRPWQHVLDPLYGYLLLAMRLYKDGPCFNGAWNFGPMLTNEKPVQWVVQKLYELWGTPLKLQINQEPQPHEASYLRLNSNKAHSLLAWHAQYKLETALKETVTWYKAWNKKQDMHDFSIKQIEHYMQGIPA